MEKKIFFVVVIVFCFFILSSCSGGGGGIEIPTGIPVLNVDFNKDELFLRIGETAKIEATVYPLNADNSEVTFSSSNENVVSILGSTKEKLSSHFVEIVAVSAGIATITVKTVDRGKIDTCSISVRIVDYILYEKWENGNKFGIFSCEIGADNTISQDEKIFPYNDYVYSPSYNLTQDKIVYIQETIDGYRLIKIVDCLTKEEKTIFPGGYHEHPRFSLDGESIVFIYREDNMSLGDVAIINSDGTDLEFITETPDKHEMFCSFSPDGEKLIFHAREKNQLGISDIYVYILSSSELINVTNTPLISEEDPVFSPDGEKIAFDSDEGGTSYWGIWVMDKNYSNKNLLYEDSQNGNGVGWPLWSDDGQRIYATISRKIDPIALVIPVENTSATEVIASGMRITDVR
ncbi:PD40 domain-containing protein [Candidatus Wolfebacteria bacterium]|nr:PD40 domain-containing protein [Candidatus Wolfebacteria bacterium]